LSKDKLLTLLEEHKGQVLSGNDLSTKLGISRNAVWKSINALRKDGHEITSIRNRGYLLELQSDHLSESEIRMHLGEESGMYNIIILDETPSTNTYIKEHKDLPDQTVVLTKTQTKGRGRLGKSFHSIDEGGIYLSILKMESLPEYNTDLATLAAALAVSETLDAYSGTETRIKWVNDIYAKGLKLSGILTEGTIEFETGTLSSLIIGIGINVNTESFPEELKGVATSLYQITGKRFVRSEIIGHLLSKLENYLLMTKKDPVDLLRKYKKKMLYLNEEINFYRGNEVSSGVLVDLNEKGHLIIETDGQTMTLNSGEISIRKREV
ncbi:MAG TPA: biotin--[acetyl-CoA-carboxylase] ligase, partial [Proteiniclasticum sp.]|nr:biotin--[acetyl-CoA-carboxylase] ligase [Proteiniclasticum sp.]